MAYIALANIIMTFIVMIFMGMIFIVMTYIVTAYTAIACLVISYAVMACIVMGYIVMADIVMDADIFHTEGAPCVTTEGSVGRLAIVRPYIGAQIDKLLTSMRQWDNDDMYVFGVWTPGANMRSAVAAHRPRWSVWGTGAYMAAPMAVPSAMPMYNVSSVGRLVIIRPYIGA